MGKQLMSVDTPSQIRYIRQSLQLIQEQRCYRSSGKPLKPPPATPLVLNKMELRGFFNARSSKMRKIGISLIVSQLDLSSNKWVTLFVSIPQKIDDPAHMQFDLPKICVSGDVRISFVDFDKHNLGDRPWDFERLQSTLFEQSKRVIAGKEAGMLFYFIFHTYFTSSASSALDVPRTEMDKAFKKSRSKLYNDAGFSRLHFTSSSTYSML